MNILTGPEYCALAMDTSGAAKAGVPAFPDNNSPGSLNSVLTPKSAILILSSLSTSRLLGFMSRCTIFW